VEFLVSVFLLEGSSLKAYRNCDIFPFFKIDAQEWNKEDKKWAIT
jgi:hypothetical protein